MRNLSFARSVSIPNYLPMLPRLSQAGNGPHWTLCLNDGALPLIRGRDVYDSLIFLVAVNLLMVLAYCRSFSTRLPSLR